MSERNHETGLEYANTDPSLHYNGIQSRRERWFPAMIYCLMNGDYEAAELIRSRNVPMSDECAAGDHDCKYLWCRCSCHSRVQFELGHKPYKAPWECASEEEELEASLR